MNKAQKKAKKARVEFNRNLKARSIAGRFHERPKVPTLDEYFALRRIIK